MSPHYSWVLPSLKQGLLHWSYIEERTREFTLFIKELVSYLQCTWCSNDHFLLWFISISPGGLCFSSVWPNSLLWLYQLTIYQWLWRIYFSMSLKSCGSTNPGPSTELRDFSPLHYYRYRPQLCVLQKYYIIFPRSSWFLGSDWFWIFSYPNVYLL